MPGICQRARWRSKRKSWRSDHCSNIAIAILEEGKEEFNPHGYMQLVKSGDDPVFQKLFREYQDFYLPNIA